MTSFFKFPSGCVLTHVKSTATSTKSIKDVIDSYSINSEKIVLKQLLKGSDSDLKPFDIIQMIEEGRVTTNEELILIASKTRNMGFYERVKRNPNNILSTFSTPVELDLNDFEEGFGYKNDYVPLVIQEFIEEEVLSKTVRKRPLILLRPRRHFKTIFFGNLLKMCPGFLENFSANPTYYYCKNIIDFSNLSNKTQAKYILLDDLNVKKTDLNMLKCLFSGQGGSFTSKYARITQIQQGLPVVFITNRMDISEMFSLSNDFKDECYFYIMSEEEYLCSPEVKNKIINDNTRKRKNFQSSGSGSEITFLGSKTATYEYLYNVLGNNYYIKL